MSAPTKTRQYRVCLVLSEAYKTYVDATDEDEAVGIAMTLYDGEGLAAFSPDSTEVDGVLAELMDKGEGR